MAAQGAVSRGALAWFSGGASLAYLYTVDKAEILRSALKFYIEQPHANGSQGHHTQQGNYNMMAQNQQELMQMKRDLEVQMLQQKYDGMVSNSKGQASAPIIIQNGTGSSSGLFGMGMPLTIAIGAGGAVALYLVSGRKLSDLFYVTQSTFSTTTNALRGGISALGGALAAAKEDLQARLGILDQKVEDSKEELKQKIESEVQLVRQDLEEVSVDIQSVVATQCDLKAQLLAIDGALDAAKLERLYASRGIYLLCKFVSNMDSQSFAQVADKETILRELQRFSAGGSPTTLSGGCNPSNPSTSASTTTRFSPAASPASPEVPVPPTQRFCEIPGARITIPPGEDDFPIARVSQEEAAAKAAESLEKFRVLGEWASRHGMCAAPAQP